MYSTDVAYTYTVESRNLRGDVVWFGGNYSSSSFGEIYETVNRYQKGQIVDVFYNPDIHTISVLEPGAKISSYMLFGFGMLFFCIGIILIGSLVLKLLVVLILIFLISTNLPLVLLAAN